MTMFLGTVLDSAAGTIGTPVTISVLTAALTTGAILLLQRASEAADRRRERYASTVATMVAWVEFAYRVRRRTDDSPATLASLANRGHDLQEQLAGHQAWIATESSAAAEQYSKARVAIGPLVGAALREAWESPSIITPSGMNLGTWGPGAGCAPAIAAMEAVIATRFGWKRAQSFVVHRRSPGTS